MALAKVEEKFQLLNEAIELLQENVKCSALDALIETFENLLDNGRVHVEDGAPDEATVAKLKDLYQNIDLASLSKEERRSECNCAFYKLIIAKKFKQITK